jgi:transcription initiation factor TFIID subunit 2
MFVKRFLLDVMRYNDNRGNDFSDDHYLSTLMLCLAQSLADTRKAANMSSFLSFEERNEEAEFQKKALEELNRHQRLDEWIPTYQNIYTTTALECGLTLMRSRTVSLKASEFLQYTRIGNADNVRLKAWDCVIQLGMFRKEAVMQYMINDIASEPSPYFRASLLHILDTALGQIAIGDEFKPDKLFTSANGGLVIEQEESLPDREAQFARRKLDGALRALKAEYTKDEAFRAAIEKALHSKTTSVCDVQELLEICGILYLPVSELKITLRYPRYWAVQHVGSGRLRFYETGRIRDKPRTPFPTTQPQVQPPQAPAAPVQEAAPPVPAPAPKVGLKIKFSNKMKAPAAEEVSTPAVVEPEVPVKAPPPLPPPPVSVPLPPPPQPAPAPPPPTKASLPPPPLPAAPVVKEKKGLKLSFSKPKKSESKKGESKKGESKKSESKKSESPASAPSPAPVIKPSPSPAPSLSAIPSPPPAPIPAQVAPAQPARESTPVIRVQKKAVNHKKSKMVVLKVPSNKLNDLANGIRIAPSISPTPGTKRKAEHPPEGPGRNIKRQASEEPLMNGYVGRNASNQNGTGRPSWSLIVKLGIGQDNAAQLRDEKEGFLNKWRKI